MFSNLSKEDWLIILVAASVFAPYYITGIVLFGVVLYLSLTHKIMPCIRSISCSKFVLIFCLLSLVISLVYQNWLGALCSLGIFVLFLFLFFFRTHITKQVFEIILDLFLILSLFHVVYGWFEYMGICTRLDLNPLDLIVKNRPENRIHTGFFNANYYAMMIEFCVLICVYKIIHLKKVSLFIYYAFIILANWFALYLTGCRTAWLPFLVSVPIMFWMNRSYIYLGLSLAGAGSIGGLIFLNPKIMQRITLAKDFGKRTRIWNAAIQGIQDYPVFGQGPLTYFKLYKLYDGHPTQHAHNIYLDLLLSHGIIGTILLFVYLVSNAKELYLIIKNKTDMRLAALIIGFIITVMLHGLLDHTLFWIQTSLLFFMVFSATSMYFKKEA